MTRTLSRESIVDAAAAIADETGLEAISFRQIGTRLGVTAMACHHHVGSKRELVDAVVARILDQALMPPRVTAATPWKTMLRNAMRVYRDVMDRHPLILEACVRSPFHPHSMAVGNQIFLALERAGLSAQRAERAWHVILGYLAGSVVSGHMLSRHQPRRRMHEIRDPAIKAYLQRIYPQCNLDDPRTTIDMGAEQARNANAALELLIEMVNALTASQRNSPARRR